MNPYFRIAYLVYKNVVDARLRKNGILTRYVCVEIRRKMQKIERIHCRDKKHERNERQREKHANLYCILYRISINIDMKEWFSFIVQDSYPELEFITKRAPHTYR